MHRLVVGSSGVDCCDDPIVATTKYAQSIHTCDM